MEVRVLSRVPVENAVEDYIVNPLSVRTWRFESFSPSLMGDGETVDTTEPKGLIFSILVSTDHQGVPQSGRGLVLGTSCWRFESSHPD